MTNPTTGNIRAAIALAFFGGVVLHAPQIIYIIANLGG
jgi:hypothetical protein